MNSPALLALLRTMLFALALLSFSTSGPLRVGSVMLAETRFGGVQAFGVLLSAFVRRRVTDRAGRGGFARPGGTTRTGPLSGDGRARFGSGDSRLRLEPARGGHDRRGDGRWCRLPGRGAHGLAAGANEAQFARARDEPDDVRRGRRRSAHVRADGRPQRAGPENNVSRGGFSPRDGCPARRGQPHGTEPPMKRDAPGRRLLHLQA